MTADKLTAETRGQRRKGSEIARPKGLTGGVLDTFAAFLNGSYHLSFGVAPGIPVIKEHADFEGLG